MTYSFIDNEMNLISVSLATKWEIASQIWHNKHELDLMRDFINKEISEHSVILDCACGTGQHTFLLSEMTDKKYIITASDKDPGNISIFNTKRKEKKLDEEIKSEIADWSTLDKNFEPETFEAVLCLGSSIPYYKSWKEGEAEYIFDDKELLDVIKQFKLVLKPGGKLIIGLSKHIIKFHGGSNIEYGEKEITGIDGVADGLYEMTWHFNYDWSNRKRTWNCSIKNKSFDNYSFSLISHLFDAEELKQYCKDVFGDDNVETQDISSLSYDVFIVCKKAMPDAPASD